MFSVNTYTMPSEKKQTLKLNGLTIDVINSKKVLIKDKMHNCSEGEATKICYYLFEEGFLKKGDITCEIVDD